MTSRELRERMDHLASMMVTMGGAASDKAQDQYEILKERYEIALKEEKKQKKESHKR